MSKKKKNSTRSASSINAGVESQFFAAVLSDNLEFEAAILPEQKLIAEVILSALIDIGLKQTRTAHKVHRDLAISWLEKMSNQPFGSLWCFEALGLHPSGITKILTMFKE